MSSARPFARAVSYLVATAVSILRFLKGHQLLLQRSVSSLVVVVLVSSVFSVANQAPYWDWNNARLAPTFALRYGYSLYYAESSGPVLSTIYTPVCALIYLPATLAASPATAVTIAATISTLLLLLPPLIICLNLSESKHKELNFGVISLALFFFWKVLLWLPSLRYSATSVHVDAGALSFSALGCICLLRYTGNQVNSTARLCFAVAACLFATISVWCKQTMVPILLALPVWVLLICGGRSALKFLFLLILMSFAGVALVSYSTSLDTFFFNVVTIPSRHPWEGQWPFNLFRVLLELQKSVVWLWLGPIGAVSSLIYRGNSEDAKLSQILRSEGWVLFVIAGILCVPTCVLGRIKVGGDLNSFSPCMYLLLIANLWIVTASLRGDSPILFEKSQKVALVIFVLVFAFIEIQDLATEYRSRSAPRPPDVSSAYAYIRTHPGKAYFPWQPLAHLMAEQRISHFDYALYDRELAGFHIEEDHLLSGIPEGATLMCLPRRSVLYQTSLRSIFSKPVELSGLPGWKCYERYK